MKKETSYKAIRATQNTEVIERVKGREKVQEIEGKGVNKGCLSVRGSSLAANRDAAMRSADDRKLAWVGSSPTKISKQWKK